MDSDGRNIPADFSHIITGRHSPTVHTVQRILKSTLLAETGENDTNTFQGKYQHLIVPFLDLDADETRNSAKAQYCFLANLDDSDVNGFLMEISQGAQLEAPNEVFDNSNWEYMATAMYDLGVLRANFIVGTKGDGTSV